MAVKLNKADGDFIPMGLSDFQVSVNKMIRASGMVKENPVGVSLPKVNIHQTDLELCRSVAGNIPPNQVFLYSGKLQTIEIIEVKDHSGKTHKTYKAQELTHTRFATWVEKFMRFYKLSAANKKGEDPEEVLVSINETKAKRILASDSFQNIVKKINDIVEVRLPKFVKGPNGERKVVLIDEGYDDDKKVFCVDTLGFNGECFKIERAKQLLAKIFCEFPWFENGSDIWRKRSFLAAISIMIGRMFWLEIGKQPMYIVWGNQEGTGKSFLVNMLLQPFQSDKVSTTPLSSNFEDVRKELNTMVKNGESYAFLDDIPTLHNNIVNMFATAPIVKFRKMGTDDVVKVENNLQMICTGNGITVSPDIARRSLITDFHLSTSSAEKKYKQDLDDNYISTPEFRLSMIRLIYSICVPWINAQCPMINSDSSKLKSFGDFAKIVSGVFRSAKIDSLFDMQRENIDGGDEIGYAVKALIKEAVNRCPNIGRYNFRVAELVDIAREIGVDSCLIGSSVDPNKALGRKLKKYKGRQYSDGKGRKYTFGQRDVAIGSVYMIIIEEEVSAQ